MESEYKAARRVLLSNWERLEAPWKSDQAKGVPVPPQEEGPKDGETLVPLVPVSEMKPRGGTLLELLSERKSRRKFTSEPLTLEEFSFLCWSAAGIKDHRPKFSFRTAPSGGARQPLDLFVYVDRVEGLETGLYRYLPVEHSLATLRVGDESAALGEALNGQNWDPAVVFVWAAVPYRSEWRYGPAAHKLIALDAGHSCENLYLACEAIGAGTCAIGAYNQGKLDTFFGLDGEDRFAMYAAPVGKRIAE